MALESGRGSDRPGRWADMLPRKGMILPRSFSRSVDAQPLVAWMMCGVVIVPRGVDRV